MLRETSYRELMKEIELTRESMVVNGMVYGFTHDDTIALSTKLDDLLNQYSSFSYRP